MRYEICRLHQATLHRRVAEHSFQNSSIWKHVDLMIETEFEANKQLLGFKEMPQQSRFAHRRNADYSRPKANFKRAKWLHPRETINMTTKCLLY